MSRRISLVVSPELAGTRVDLLLRRQLGLSGTVLRRIKWLPDGILVDGQRVNTRYVPAVGQELSVRLSDPQRRSGIVPAQGPLEIVYEDEDLVVLNKAPGVPVHPGPGHFSDTLGNFLLFYYDTYQIEADFHPVHRLDRTTSGLLVAAKHPHAQEVLKSQLHSPLFRRGYLAVCEGELSPAAGVIDAPLGPKPGSLVEQMVRPDGKPARTRYETLGVFSGRSLLFLELETGRTHQIRVHLAHLGHPLTGDFLYGREDRDVIARPALHSALLTLRQPITGETLRFSLPPPPDMTALLPEEERGALAGRLSFLW
jgi:23S rRNA pseudouridine1911/1915/1917 synthase